MVRRKKHPERPNLDRWLVSYANFITLLFAFFVVMFAASNSDQKKAGQIAQAVQVAFKQMAIFAPNGKVVPLYDSGTLPSDSNQVIESNHSVFDAAQLVAGSKPGSADTAMRDIRSQLQVKLREELASGSLRISDDSRGLTISLAESGFCSPGSAVMSPAAKAAVDRIATTVRPYDYNIRV